jgi:hypothetical protein
VHVIYLNICDGDIAGVPDGVGVGDGLPKNHR